ncbi:MAG: 50S ribosomal protein L24 [SAR202 cluster bacterium]|nr:50S ribosomal protein L24 [SAR202 cluster bacterium]
MALKIKNGDTVQVRSGKDRGKRGKVIRVLPREGQVVIEGVNVITRHRKARPGTPQAGIIKQESPIAASKVMVFHEQHEKAVRIGFRFLADGKKVRYCKICNQTLE